MNARRTAVHITMLLASVACAQQPGDLDLTFSGDGIATAHSAPIGVDYAQGVVIQPDGRIVTVGSTQQDSPTSIALARFMPDGTLDPAFGSGGKVVTSIGVDPILISDVAMGVALQPDGKIVVVGSSFLNGSGDRFLVVRYNSDGTLDTSFGTNGIRIDALLNGGRFTSVAIRDDGYLIAGGVVNDAPSNEMFIAARYAPNGALDTSFDGDGFATIDITPDDDAANDIALEPGGGILITRAGSELRFIGSGPARRSCSASRSSSSRRRIWPTCSRRPALAIYAITREAVASFAGTDENREHGSSDLSRMRSPVSGPPGPLAL